MKSGGRKLMGKLRRSGSNASTTSNSSTSSVTAEQLAGGPSFQGSSVLGRARSGPQPSTSVAPKARDVVDVAPTLQEVDEEAHEPQQGGLGLANGNGNANGMGDETPRRGRTPSPTHHAPHQHHHFERSPSPPPEVFHDEDEDDSDMGSPKVLRANGDVHPTDDAEYEHRMHHGSTSAALGFEMSNYNGQPSWARGGAASAQ